MVGDRQKDPRQEISEMPWVFYTDEDKHLYWFCKVWVSACDRAQIPDLLFHDLRGIPRKVAMSISGQKRENIYRRYDIIAERDLSSATTQMDRYFNSMKEQSESRQKLVDKWATHFWALRRFKGGRTQPGDQRIMRP